MAREVNWADPAWDDVENAADYIARDSKFYAAAFVEQIKQAFEESRPVLKTWSLRSLGC